MTVARFVEDDLRQYFSDVLYSVKTMEGDGYVHVLIEYQSSLDKHMAFRSFEIRLSEMDFSKPAVDDAYSVSFNRY